MLASEDTAPRFLLRERDGNYGKMFRDVAEWLGIEEVLCAPRSPWQNAYAEQLIGFDTPRMSGSCNRLPRAAQPNRLDSKLWPAYTLPCSHASRECCARSLADLRIDNLNV